MRGRFLAAAAAALLGGFFMAGPTTAETVCFDTESFYRIVAELPNTRVAADLRGAEAAAFIASFNEIDPATAYTAERVLVFFTPPALVEFVMFSAGCYLAGARIEFELFRTRWPEINLEGRTT